jgi:hypothetical protein
MKAILVILVTFGVTLLSQLHKKQEKISIPAKA